MSMLEMRGKTAFVILETLLLFHAVAHAADFSSANFTVKDPSLTQGAGYATSANYRLWSSVGQVSIGTSTAASFGLKSGFLYFPAAVSEVSVPQLPQAATEAAAIGGAGFLGIIKKLFPQKTPEPTSLPRFDLSGDGIIGMADLSILLYFYEKPPSLLASLPPQRKSPDFNGDGIVNLVDASILLFYWV